MGKNLFSKPFDEGTLDKLKIFEDYFKEWLPVFIARKEIIWKEIKIFDLFAGEGFDIEKNPGSPAIILKVLKENEDLIVQSKVKISVVFNEIDKDKFIILQKNLNEIAEQSFYSIEYYNEDFINVFNLHFESMKKSANFLFLDQNGIKQITEEVFEKLISLRQTDFIFFISSSYIKRFAEVEEFKKYLKINKEELEGKSYYHVHRIVLNYYRSKIPKEKSYFLAPFSIKKPAGIYGLIFGTNHTLGIEKFLQVCWKHDKLRGEANFDIDNEKINIRQPGLFEEYNTPNKRQVFESSLKQAIVLSKLITDREVYLYALNEGFLIKDANKVLKSLEQEKKIRIDFKLHGSDIHKIKNPSKINKVK